MDEINNNNNNNKCSTAYSLSFSKHFKNKPKINNEISALPSYFAH
jgi:hypothetical protein